METQRRGGAVLRAMPVGTWTNASGLRGDLEAIVWIDGTTERPVDVSPSPPPPASPPQPACPIRFVSTGECSAERKTDLTFEMECEGSALASAAADNDTLPSDTFTVEIECSYLPLEAPHGLALALAAAVIAAVLLACPPLQRWNRWRRVRARNLRRPFKKGLGRLVVSARDSALQAVGVVGAVLYALAPLYLAGRPSVGLCGGRLIISRGAALLAICGFVMHHASICAAAGIKQTREEGSPEDDAEEEEEDRRRRRTQAALVVLRRVGRHRAEPASRRARRDALRRGMHDARRRRGVDAGYPGASVFRPELLRRAVALVADADVFCVVASVAHLARLARVPPLAPLDIVERTVDGLGTLSADESTHDGVVDEEYSLRGEHRRRWRRRQRRQRDACEYYVAMQRDAGGGQQGLRPEGDGPADRRRRRAPHGPAEPAHRAVGAKR